MKRKLRRIVSGTLAVILCVAMNINPLATLGTALIESGFIDATSNIGRNVIRMIGDQFSGEVYATSPVNQLGPLTAWETVETSSCECPDYTSILQDINGNLEYEDGPQLDTIRRDTAVIKGYSEDLVEITTSIDTTTKAILQDTHYIIQQLGYDPNATGVAPKNVKESFERVSEQLDSITHEYRVANIKSINNMFAGALWKPKFDEVPNLTEYCEITGGFANTYSGYWDTSYDETVESVLPTDVALETLGYDAILRAEGIVPEGVVIPLGSDSSDESEVSIVVPYDDTLNTTTFNKANEVVVYDSEGNLDVVYNDWGQVTDSYNVTKDIPTSQMIGYRQITMPSTDITYLDAVTVLYKALGEDIVTLEGLYTRNPEIEVESSPLAQGLSGVADEWEGYDYYVFATRSNPISYEIEGDNILVRYDYAYWKKAVMAGFVNYNLRDEPISAVDFCTLAAKMMEAYGEPVFTDDELHTLLQVYGSSYPIQMGEKIALSWAYLKARGIITEDNFPEVYTNTLSRNQLLDMCARIKNPDLRDTYKNIELAITLDDVVIDDGVYPYYNFSIDNGSNMFLETTIDYTTLSHYTYLFPMTTDQANSVNLGYGGAGYVFNSTEYTTLVQGAIYNGMIKLDDLSGGHYYYCVQIPKDYKGNAYLKFIDWNDPTRDIGTVESVEFNPSSMVGGIFTQYELKDGSKGELKIATLAAANPLENENSEGVNWYSFATQPNNMDLIWFGDIIRCNDTSTDEPEVETAALTTTYNPTFSEQVEVFWNNLITPMEVCAASTGSTIPTAEHFWYLNDAVVSNGKYSSGIDFGADDPQKYIKTVDSVNLKDGVAKLNSNGDSLVRCVDSKALTYIARAAFLSEIDYHSFASTYMDYINTYNSGVLSDSYAIKPDLIRDAISGIRSGDASKGGSVRNYAKKAFNEYNNGDADGTQAGKYFKDQKDFILYYYLAANGYKDQELKEFSDVLRSEDVLNELTSVTLSTEINKLFLPNNNQDANNKFNATPIATDGTFSATGSDDLLNIYKETIANYLSKDFFESTGDIGLKEVDFSNTLETSVLMDRDNQIFISWKEMVYYGLATDIDSDGLPKLTDTDGVYEFVTPSGVVRVDDVNKIIQIGTQIYSFQYEDDPPTLVHSNADGTDIYFDVRCITGVSNSNGYTLDAGKASTRNKLIGTGDYTILCLSSGGSKTSGSMKTEKTEYKPYADYVDSSSTNTYSKMDTIIRTIYDGNKVANSSAGNASTGTATDFQYWKDDNGNELNDSDGDGRSDEVGLRITMNNTNPTDNWIFVTYDDGKSFGGRLYVFYLRQAFDEGFLDVNGNLETVTPHQKFIDSWEGTQYSDAMTRLANNYPNIQFNKAFSSIYGENQDTWQMKMTKCALANLAADTGVVWSSANYYVRMFDYTNASAAYNTYQSDFTQNDLELPATVTDQSNKAGAVYFLDYLGYIYNMPYTTKFDLKDYYSGKYPLPLAYNSGGTVVNYNFNYYGSVNSVYKKGVDLPLGVELTSRGFIRYTKDSSTEIYDNLESSIFDNAQTGNRIEPPYATGTAEDTAVSKTFTAAPAGVYMRYGLFRNADYDKRLSDINQSYTYMNEFYIGTRRVQMSDDNSPTAEYRYWVYGPNTYGPIALSANLTAQLCHKYLHNTSTTAMTSAYIINTNNVQAAYLTDMGDVITLGVTTPEIDWDGRAKLISILDAVDRGTNWWIWVCLTLAPMICVILMTILIGMSFLTENKLWQKFCEQFFDPVKLFTFGASDSNRWVWRKVLIPCIITYIAFALLCNANILKIVVYIVDTWMKLLNAI